MPAATTDAAAPVTLSDTSTVSDAVFMADAVAPARGPARRPGAAPVRHRSDQGRRGRRGCGWRKAAGGARQRRHAHCTRRIRECGLPRVQGPRPGGGLEGDTWRPRGGADGQLPHGARMGPEQERRWHAGVCAHGPEQHQDSAITACAYSSASHAAWVPNASVSGSQQRHGAAAGRRSYCVGSKTAQGPAP